MILKFFFKKINISHLRLKNIIKKISKLSLKQSIIYFEFFSSKISYILKRILNNIKYSLKSKKILNIDNIFFNRIIIGKDFFLKKIFIRSRGRTDIKKRYFSNLYFFLYIN